MATQILEFLTAQMDRLMLAGIVLLVIFSALQLHKMSRINRQLIHFGEKLTGYLETVLAEEDADEVPEEKFAEENADAFMSRQEQDMRDSLEQQKQQKKLKDAQIFDAVLSEIFP